MHKHYSKITKKFDYIYYLDENWFYITHCKNNLKDLHKEDHEDEGVVTFIRTNIVSHYFPVNLIFLGVVGKLLPHRDFDGELLLDRVSEEVEVIRMTLHQNFSDNVLVNNTIKDGEWRMIVNVITYLSLSDIINTIAEYYDLEYEAFTKLELSYVIYIVNAGKTK